MVPIDPLRRRARAHYELGRARRALLASWWVAPLVAFSLWFCRVPWSSLVGGAALFAVAFSAHFAGRVYGRAIGPGALAGLVPLVAPAFMRSSSHCCLGGGCWSSCMIACVGAGLVGGAGIVFVARSERESQPRFVATAAVVAACTGVMGCGVAGTAGIAGMALALLVASLPVAVLQRRGSPAT